MEEIKNTINTEEINKFSQLADEWWKVDGKFKTLHKFNPIRLKFIIDQSSKQLHQRSLSASKIMSNSSKIAKSSSPISI